jgi:hypothetical protein
MASENTLLGAAGEHYVMCELLRRGYIAALAPHGVPNADIVVTDIEGTRLCSIHVKTRRYGSSGGWIMSAKHERIRGERLFYCFVDFQKVANESPSYLLFPRPSWLTCYPRLTESGWRPPEDWVRYIRMARSDSSFPAILISSLRSNTRSEKDG